MNMFRASFKIIEPMVFRDAGEFDPSTRGTYSHAKTLLLPSPSTIAGTLAMLLFNENIKFQEKDWVKEYKAILGENINIKGPFLKVEDEIYVENRLIDCLVNVKDLVEYTNSIYNLLKSGSLSNFYANLSRLNKIIVEIKEKSIAKRYKKVGIGLLVRKEGKKITDEERGLIYICEFVYYTKDNKFILPEIIVDIFGGKINVSSNFARFGGEGRITKFDITETEKTIIRSLNLNIEKANALYVVSPIIYNTGIDFINELQKDLNKYNLKIKEINGKKAIYGKISIIGTGFNLRSGRRPIYQALLPGSVIFLENYINGEEIYKEGLGIAREIGYGTVLPLFIQDS